jgi:hypothetical protein
VTFLTKLLQHGDQPKIDKCLGTALVESNSFSAARALDSGNSSLFFLVTDTPTVRQRFLDAMPNGRAEFQQEDLIGESPFSFYGVSLIVVAHPSASW